MSREEATTNTQDRDIRRRSDRERETEREKRDREKREKREKGFVPRALSQRP